MRKLFRSTFFLVGLSVIGCGTLPGVVEADDPDDRQCGVIVGHDPALVVCDKSVEITGKVPEKPLDPGPNSVPAQIERNITRPIGEGVNHLGGEIAKVFGW